MNAKISIIIPCYNQAQYLDECLLSVFNQTYSNWECIIVDDDSPDNTKEVVEKWIEKDSRFKYLYKQNGGLSSARNAGIEVATGEWILPLDADDKISNQYLELAEKVFDKDYKVIYCKAEKFGVINEFWELLDFTPKTLARTNIIFCTAFFRKKSWEEVGGYDINMLYGLEDWEFWISLLKDGGKVYRIDEVCFYYRIKENSMITELTRARKMLMLSYIEKKHLDFFHQHLGSIHDLNFEKEQNQAKAEYYNQQLQKLISSKRYRLMEKLFSIFNR
ncbi:Glycosyltransferase involved in cell wall bisynthesis [Chryseobacterium ureilyticum]|uniref:Glycosyltransferase involved in cell wall bisynthesis n=1 Tax=Chryseobacterium ureilyticum TaxID=373668 RepID=A0A1N7NED0_9FLAO|nr:glycosyltransferase family A protein [Chryseobacterium ureilyticum]SIS96763.1 Glycosyltransferase involved in cell wall bisynthesis [Chryseobacterium ureilyticum]